MVFTRSRAVIANGAGARNLTMRGCLMSESRRGGLIITEADNTAILFNDFRWVGDDPVAITMAADTTLMAPYASYLAAGGLTQIIGNRCFGCRGLNVVGTKNVLIEGNICVLCRGRAIHIGCGTDQDKGDTTTLNIIIRYNIIADLLDAQVDPDQVQASGSHRVIDIEMLQTAPNPVGAPGLPDASGAIADPTQYHYKQGQGLNGRRIWKPGDVYTRYPATPTPANPPTGQEWETWWLGRIYRATDAPATVFPPTGGTTAALHPPVHTTSAAVYDGPGPGAPGGINPGVPWEYVAPQSVLPVPQSPTPHSGNILIEGNIIARTRPPAVAQYLPSPPNPPMTQNPDWISGFTSFDSYGVGYWGGFAHAGSPAVTVTLDQITPDEGIAIGGSVRGLVIRGNQIRNCSTGILFYGKNLPVPFSLLDVTVENNDLFDWKIAGIRFKDYEYTQAGQPTAYSPQRVSILNNRADGDPFCWNQFGTVRNTGGTWFNVTKGAFVDVTNLGLVLIAGNHVRNVSQLVVGFDLNLHAMQDNVGYCNPAPVASATLVYNPADVGIGTLIAPQLGWRYVIEGGNPALSDWGKVLNTCPLATGLSTAPAATDVPPVTGTWVAGTYVANLTAAPVTGTSPKYEIAGWRRMTTGSTNGLGVDWQQQRVMVS